MVIAPRLIAEYQALKTGLPADLLLLMQMGTFMQVPGLPGYRLIVQRGRHWDVDTPQAFGATERRPRAWIIETGGRLGPLRERRIAGRSGCLPRSRQKPRKRPAFFPARKRPAGAKRRSGSIPRRPPEIRLATSLSILPQPYRSNDR